MPRPTFNVALIGLGGICQDRHLPYWRERSDACITHLVDVNPQTRQFVAQQLDKPHTCEHYQQIIDDPAIDIVDIITPNAFHAPIAKAALAAGKHVLCEKPMALTAADAHELVRLAQQHQRKLMINHQLRLDPIMTMLHRVIAQGHAGEIYHVHAGWTRRRGVPPSPTFVDQTQSGGGAMLDLGIHMIDLAWWLAQAGPGKTWDEPVIVSGRTASVLGGQEGLSGMWGSWNPQSFTVDDHGLGLFTFGSCTIYLDISWLRFQQESERRWVSVYGTQAGLHWPQGTIVSEKNHVPTDHRLADPACWGSNLKTDAYRATIHGFLDAIVHDTPVPIDPAQSAWALQLIEALYTASKTGQPVTVPPRS